jgi:iron(III) transport system substrate-binding protein
VRAACRRFLTMPKNPNNKDHWFRDMLTYGPFTGLPLVIIVGLLAAIVIPVMMNLKGRTNVVIIYTSQDQEYAEPIFKKFTEQYGINVRPVYDNEAAKTVGLVNRLIAEKNNPQCDVFWNNEELRTRQLARDEIVETNWVAFGFRTRRLVVNTNLLPLARAPGDVLSLTNSEFRGKVAIAYPLFGTTSAHFLALRQIFGQSGWENWCRALAANKPFVVDGNSVVVKMVGKGEAIVGLTDSDDVLSGQHDGLPVDSILPAKDGFIIRNTAAIVVNAPHRAAAEKLIDYLKSPDVIAELKKAGAIEPSDAPKKSSVTWTELLATQSKDLDFLKGLFLR